MELTNATQENLAPTNPTLTKRQRQVFSAYTGITFGKFEDVHEYIEEIMERPVFTHELGQKYIWEQIANLSKDEFMELIKE